MTTELTYLAPILLLSALVFVLAMGLKISLRHDARPQQQADLPFTRKRA